ncbi:MAG: cob(I)yrinic acid a,c-diamide adenosyltransferase, partial [Promethearchaeota archaeon]
SPQRKNAGLKRGLIHYYYGDGKGKTTTLMGVIIRALGHRLKPILIQFLKLHDDNDNGKGYFIGEINFLNNFIPIEQFGTRDFINADNKAKKSVKKIVNDGLDFTKKIITESNYDIVALDEIINLISLGFIELEELIEILENKPTNMEIICTGAMYYRQIEDISHYTVQFNCINHPYYEGIGARKGIEY